MRLTEKEIAVLHLVAEGRTLHSVSRELNIAESTVKSHAAKAAARLGVRNSREAARIASSLGLLVAKAALLGAALFATDLIEQLAQLAS